MAPGRIDKFSARAEGNEDFRLDTAVVPSNAVTEVTELELSEGKEADKLVSIKLDKVDGSYKMPPEIDT